VTAWQKARAVIAQALPAAEVAERVKTLRFSAYEQVAQTQVDAQKRQADLRALFDQGLSQYETKHFSRALNTFRQLAIQEPEYPLLGKYLVQAEAAAEQERTKRLGEEKRQEVAKLLEQGVRALEKEDYPRAESSFVGVLKIDPTHPQARSYLTMVRAEVDRRHDPKAAQMHYETGLIAYASGKLEDAVREWRLAVRLDPAHEKAINALNKAQKELALNSETP